MAKPWTVLLLVSSLAVPASALDLLVDASGQQSGFTSVASAMAVARPGDRLLLLPGDYPAFQMEVGVHVVGLGDLPADVRVARADIHVSEPDQGYDALLANLTLGSESPLDAIALSGNESPPGSFVLDNVVVLGGVFLGGGADGFHVQLNHVEVSPGAGQGFGGAAVHFGGSAGFSFQIVDSTITGWDADDDLGLGASSGLDLSGPVSGQIVQSTLRGGAGSAALPGGGTAIRRFGLPGAVQLRLDGDSQVRGGAAGGEAAGGHGVDLDGTLRLGTAQVSGGVGAPAGAPFVGALDTPALADSLHLQVSPASGDGPVASGDSLTWSLSGEPFAAALLIGLELDVPGGVPQSPLTQPLIVWFGDALELEIPDVGLEAPGLSLFAMAWVRPDPGQPLWTSNVATRLVDLTTGPQP